MYKAQGLTPTSDSSDDLSFRFRDDWVPVVPNLINYNALVLGDGEAGPSVNLIAVEPPGLPPAPAHGHASDSFRICIKGHQLQGRKAYGPGEFRFQEGWVPYADEGFGDDGMWAIILLADRRGCRARLVDPELDQSDRENRFRVAQKERNQLLGIEIDDMLSDDPNETSGPSAGVTTLGTVRGKLDGSFDDVSSWESVGPHTKAVVALMGEATTGPVITLAATEAGAVAAPRTRFETELMRVVISGSCTIGGKEYQAGDAQLFDVGAWCDEVIAGPDGLNELLVLADRRGATATIEAAEAAWPGQLSDIVSGLSNELAALEPSKRSEKKRLAALASA